MPPRYGIIYFNIELFYDRLLTTGKKINIALDNPTQYGCTEYVRLCEEAQDAFHDYLQTQANVFIMAKIIDPALTGRPITADCFWSFILETAEKYAQEHPEVQIVKASP
jgi:hypothetical protein